MKWYLEVLKKYATFTGRARRSEYWYFFLFNILFSIAFGSLDAFLGTFDNETGRGLVGTIYSLAVFIPSIAVGVRRIHDVGKSGWFLLIPLYNFILLVTEGDSGSNEYGEDPKNPQTSIMDQLV